MARLQILASADAAASAATYETTINALLAPLLSQRIGAWEATITDKPPAYIRLMRAYFDVDTTGGVVITHPYKVKVIEGASEADAQAAAITYIAANPTFWIAPGIFVYSDLLPNVSRRYLVFLLYNQSATDGPMNWSPGYVVTGGGIAPVGPAGGDLANNYPNPTVVGIKGVAIFGTAMISGSTLVYNAVTNQYDIVPPVQYFASSAAAVAAAAITPFVNGTTIVISPGAPPAEAGTYQVTSNGGVAFPADYTLVSSTVITASNVGITDAGGYYTATNVEDALQEIGAGISGMLTAALAAGANVVATQPIAGVREVEWSYALEKGTVVYSERNRAVHDGTTPSNMAYGASMTAGVVDVIMTVDISAGNLRLIATAATGGWTIKYRTIEVTT